MTIAPALTLAAVALAAVAATGGPWSPVWWLATLIYALGACVAWADRIGARK